MRSSKSRSRSKSNRQRSLGNIVNRVFDSSGPEGKVRGTPQQIIDKYLSLARDAQLSNDRVAEQAFLQHAEHYTRMLGDAQREMAERQQNQQNYHQQQNNRGGDDQQNRGGDDNRGNGGQDGAPPAQGDAARADNPPDRETQPEEPAAAPPAKPRGGNQRGTRRKEAALPDAVNTDSEGGESRVETPEEKLPEDAPAPAPARRTRASGATTSRTRRKPAADQPDGDTLPAGGAEQG